jgi:hypothetical protein
MQVGALKLGLLLELSKNRSPRKVGDHLLNEVGASNKGYCWSTLLRIRNNILNKKNGQSCKKRSTTTNIQIRREYMNTVIWLPSHIFHMVIVRVRDLLAFLVLALWA